MIRLRTLGECVIEIDGESYTPDSDVLFGAVLYLAMERGRYVPRQVLADMLWPDQEGTRARHSLRQLLYRLRIAGVAVEGGRDTLLLPESEVAPTFSAAPAGERLVAERAAGTLRLGPFLPGYTPPFSSAFDEWLDRARSMLDARVRRVLLEAAQVHKLRGEWDHVDVLAAEVLHIDPLNEEATLIRAEATAMVGAKTEAVEMLDRFMEDIGPARTQLQVPAAVLRKRIAERFPALRSNSPTEHCFVGRAEILETLSTSLLRARKGAGDVILITGEPGIGKSRFVRELTKVAAMQGVRTAQASVIESDTRRPFSAFASIVPQIRTLKGAIGVAPEALALLDRLNQGYAPGLELPVDASNPHWLASRIADAIIELCDSVAAETPLLLVLEDVHWLDSMSWMALDALVQTVDSRRILLVLTARSPFRSLGVPQRLLERVRVHQLPRLGISAATVYARAIISERGDSLDDSSLLWCVSASGGNPLLLRELVLHRVEHKFTETIPRSIEGLLDAHITRLSPVARRILDAIAVLGEFSTTGRLYKLLELPAHELAAGLGELADEQLLTDDPATVRIGHELLEKRVLNTMSALVRRLLHERAALTLADGRQESASIASLLAAARHWQAAGTGEIAAKVLDDASVAITRLGALPDSIRLLEVAVDLSTTSSHRIRLKRKLARQLALNAQWPRVSAVIATLLNEEGWQRESDEGTADLILEIEAAYRAGSDPTILIPQTVMLARNSILSGNARLAAGRQGLVIATNAVYEAAQIDIWQALKPLSKDPGTDRLDLLSLQVIVEANTGSLSDAIALAKQLYEAATTERELERRLSAQLNAAQAYYVAGLHDQALPMLEQLRRDAHTAGALYHEVSSMHRIVETHMDRRDVERSRASLNTLRQLVSRVTGPLHQHSMRDDEVRLAELENRWDDAYRLAAEAYNQLELLRFPLPWQRRSALTTLVEVMLECRESPIGDDLLQELYDVHIKMQRTFLHDRTVSALALALEARGDAALAKELVQEYVSIHRRSLVQWISPSVGLSLQR